MKLFTKSTIPETSHVNENEKINNKLFIINETSFFIFFEIF